MEKEVLDAELIGKLNWLVEPFLLKNTAVTADNLQQACELNIAQLTISLKDCESLTYDNPANKQTIKNQINSAIEELKNAYTKQESAQELIDIMDNAVAEVENLQKDKKLYEFLLKLNVSDSNSIENQLAEQGKSIQAKLNFVANYAQAKINLFAYSAEDKKLIKSKISSINKKIEELLEEYKSYTTEQNTNIETETATV